MSDALAARYGTFDLTDDPVTGGEESNLTLGVNRYNNPNIRLMTHNIRVDDDKDVDGDVLGGDRPRAS